LGLVIGLWKNDRWKNEVIKYEDWKYVFKIW
jgi:hypothetical protein